MFASINTFFASQIPQKYWIGLFGGLGNISGSSVAVDGSGNTYMAGTIAPTPSFPLTYDSPILCKYDVNGILQWQKYLDSAGFVNAIATDAANNVYICGTAYNGTGGGVLLVKYDTLGAIQWQRTLDSGSTDEGYSITISASGNIYVCGTTVLNGNVSGLVAKYSTAGVLQWQSILSATPYSTLGTSFSGIAVDTSDNVYVSGSFDTTGSGDRVAVTAKYNSSGALQWQQTLNNLPSSNLLGVSVSVNNSGEPHIALSGTTFGVAKYNTSGALQWQQKLSSGNANAIALDSSNNIYACGFNTSLDALLVKYDSLGAIQWQRSLSSSGNEVAFSVFSGTTNAVRICGRTDNTMLFAKFPTDGTPTGTYLVGSTNYTYAATAYTGSTTSFVSAAGALTSYSGSLVDSASSYVDTTATETSSVTFI